MILYVSRKLILNRPFKLTISYLGFNGYGGLSGNKVQRRLYSDISLLTSFDQLLIEINSHKDLLTADH